MKILIYGTGVLGSYLAHSFCKAGYDVTMLARGERLEQLRNGLKIKHVLQRNETLDKVSVVDSLEKDDFYDFVFVVMQANQIQAVYQTIIENERCPLFIFVGNNIDPKTTNSTIVEGSKLKREVLFAFLSVGGRREDGKTISLHIKNPTMHVGTFAKTANNVQKERMDALFEKTNLKYEWFDNMEGYLKTHIAVIMPLGYLAYISNFKLHRLFFKGKILSAAILARKEGFDALENIGVQLVIPEELEMGLKTRFREQFFMRTIILPPIGRLAVCDHCRAAQEEMRFIEEALLSWLKASGIELKGYKYLMEVLEKKGKPVF